MAVVVDDPDAMVIRVPANNRARHLLRSHRSLGWLDGIGEQSCPTPDEGAIPMPRINENYPVAVWALQTRANTAHGSAAFDVFVCNNKGKVETQGTVTLVAPSV